MPLPIECPHEDQWKTTEEDLAPAVGQFIEHYVDDHGQSLPTPLQDTLKACARELQELSIPTT